MVGGTPKSNPPDTARSNPSDPAPWDRVLERLTKMEQDNKEGFNNIGSKVSQLVNDFATMQSSQASFQTELGEMKAESAQIKEDVATASRRADDAHSRIDELKQATENRFRELETALLNKARALPVQFPTLSAGQQLSINERFEALRVQAKSCRNIFVFGHVPDFAQPASLKSVITNFFLKCEMKQLPKAGNTKVWRVSVPMGKEELTKKIAEANVFGIRDHGWWVQQDLPPKLREMHSNAYAFIKLVKDRFRRLRPFLFEAEDGHFMVEKTPLVPVYLIPTKKDKWNELATVLASEIGGMVETEWLESVVSSNINVASVVEKWSAVLGISVNCVEGAHVTEEDDMGNEGDG
jgi:hypothetical protein